MTKETGATTAWADYDAWGVPLSPKDHDMNMAGVDNAVSFTSYTYDKVLDLYFAQARFYDANSRRFISVDPIKDGVNWYAYCGNSPTVFVDPLGLNPVPLWAIRINMGKGTPADIQKALSSSSKSYTGQTKAAVEDAIDRAKNTTGVAKKTATIASNPPAAVATATPPIDDTSGITGNIFTVAEGIQLGAKALVVMLDYYSQNMTVQNTMDAGGTTVFGIEGLGNYMGGTNDYHPNGMYGAMMVVVKGTHVVYITKNASTLPDFHPKDGLSQKPTILDIGVHQYKAGTHAGAYTGMRSVNYEVPTRYINNNGIGYSGVGVGMNIHAGGNNRATNPSGAWSAGCQIVRWSDYVDFGKAVGFLDETTPNILGPSSVDISKIGTSHQRDVTVTYVVDRRHMSEETMVIWR